MFVGSFQHFKKITWTLQIFVDLFRDVEQDVVQGIIGNFIYIYKTRCVGSGAL